MPVEDSSFNPEIGKGVKYWEEYYKSIGYSYSKISDLITRRRNNGTIFSRRESSGS